jgi:HEPN domain-containing protein
MRPDPTRLEDTKAWSAKADNDLRFARIALAAQPPALEDVVFHCQQAVEKAEKAFLTWHDEPFRKTHSLAELGTQRAAIEPALAEVLRRANRLTSYVWRFRYPGVPEAPTDAETGEALVLAQQAVQAIRERLPAEARS